MPRVPPQPVEQMEPVPAMLARIREELPAAFIPGRPIRLSRAPHPLELIGGSAASTGSLVVSTALNRTAAVALQERDDREVQIFSFNQFDDHKPFTLRISLDSLRSMTADELSHGFNEPGRGWAGGLVGALFVLHVTKHIDLRDPTLRGLNLALYTTALFAAGMESAALTVAAMINLRDHFNLAATVNPRRLAALCRDVNQTIGTAQRGVIDPLTSMLVEPDHLLRLHCQPHPLAERLVLPPGVRILAVASEGDSSPDPAQRTRRRDAEQRIRSAAFIGHRILLEKMRQIGRLARRTLEGDPMGGLLANLSPEDYRKFFRPHLPETIKGGEFLLRYGGTIDPSAKIDPDHLFAVRSVTDHHIFEAARAKAFAALLEEAATADIATRRYLFREAGHLMYESDASVASHLHVASAECEWIVEHARQYESAGVYGARTSTFGSEGIVALLAGTGPEADAAIADLLSTYRAHTGRLAEVIPCSTTGAWHTATAVA